MSIQGRRSMSGSEAVSGGLLELRKIVVRMFG